MKSKGKLIIYNLEIIAFSIVSTRMVEMFSDTFGTITKYLLETIVFITVVMAILVNRWIVTGTAKLLYNCMFGQDTNTQHISGNTKKSTNNTTNNTIKNTSHGTNNRNSDISKDTHGRLEIQGKYKKDSRINLGDADSKSPQENIKRYSRNGHTQMNRIVDIGDRKSTNEKEKDKYLEYKNRIRRNKNRRTFGDNIKYILNQMDRFVSKLKILSEMIELRFKKGEITYTRLHMGLEELGDIFYKNILRIIHKLEAFDESEYFHTMNEKSNVSRRIMDQKNRIYREYKSIIKELIETNEEILIKMDELILEFSGLSIQEDKKGGKLVATEKIDELIGMTRLYK